MRFFQALAVVLCMTSSANAWTHGYAFGQTVLNLGQAAPYFGQDYPWANYFKSWALSAFLTGNNPVIDPSVDTFDANGYPTSASLSKNYQGAINFVPTSQLASSITWIIRWDGQLGTSVGGLKNISSGALNVVDPGSCVVQNDAFGFTVRGTNCSVTFTWRTTTSNAPTFTLLSTTAFNGTLNNLFLGKLSDWNAGASANPNTFPNPDFVAVLKQLHPKALRFLNYNGTNNGNGSPQSMQTDYSNIVPAGYMSYLMDQLTAWSGVATGGGTNSYTLTCSAPAACNGVSAYTDGLTIQAKFTNVGSSGNPTFCLNSINACVGAPGIYTQSGNFGTRTMTPLSATRIAANNIETLRYDGLLGLWIAGCQSGCAPDFNGGASIEAMVQLANAVSADLWYTVPCYASDNLVTGVVNKILASLGSGQNLIVENANEVWNTIYACTSWSAIRGKAFGWIASNNQDWNSYYGLRSRQIAGLVESAASGLGKTNYKIVMANQFSDESSSETSRLYGNALSPTSNSPLCLWLGGTFSGTCSGAPDYSSSPNRPFDHVHLVAYAPYYAGAQLSDLDLNYVSFSGQTPRTVNGATAANPTTLQTSVAHGYSTGDRVCTGTITYANSISAGTAFTGNWAALNQQCYNVTVTDSTHFTVPLDSSAFSAYSANGGAAQRQANQMTTLTGAADSWALGNFATALSALDGDIRAGTNYGLAPTAANNNAYYPVASFISTYYPSWATAISTYNSSGHPSRPNGVANVQSAMYENGFQGVPPSGASFTATISGGVMNVSSVQSGALVNGQTIYFAGAPTHAIYFNSGAGGGTGNYNLTNAGALSVSTPTAMVSGPCAWFEISISYCGYDGKINNMLGAIGSAYVGGVLTQLTPSTNSYKVSSTFGSTVKYQLDQFMLANGSNAAYPGWLLITGGGQWALMQGDIYSTPFASFGTIGAYKYP